MSTGACLVPVMDNTVASGRFYTSKMCSSLSSRDFLSCRKSLNGTRRHSSTDVRLNGHLPANNPTCVGNSLQPPLHPIRRDIEALDGRTKSLACELSKIRQTVNSFVDSGGAHMCTGETRNWLKEVSDKITFETERWGANLAREACERRQLDLFFRMEMQKLCDLVATPNADLAPSDSREGVEKDISAGGTMHQGIPAALSDERLNKDTNFTEHYNFQHDLKKDDLLGLVNALKDDIKVIKVDAQHTATEIVALKGGVENLSTTLKSDITDGVTVLKQDINLIKADAQDRANELVALKGSAESFLATETFKSDLKAEKKERIDEVLDLKEDIKMMKVDARERASEILALRSSAEYLSAMAALKSDLEAEKAERMEEAAELRAENISDKKLKALEIATLRDELDEERQKISALNESTLVWLQQADSRRKEVECQAGAHENVALQRDLAASQNTIMQQVEELANNINCETIARTVLSKELETSQVALVSRVGELSSDITGEVNLRKIPSKELGASQDALALRVAELSNSITDEVNPRKMLSKELADAKRDVELLKTDNATETTARDGENVTEGSCASSAGGDLDMERVGPVTALTSGLDSVLKEIQEFSPRDISNGAARRSLAEELSHDVCQRLSKTGHANIDVLVEKLCQDHVQSLWKQAGGWQHFAASQDVLLKQVEELSNGLDSVCKANTTLQENLAATQESFASRVAEVYKAMDGEAQVRTILLKDLATSREMFMSRLEGFTKSIGCKVEARTILSKDLVTSQERFVSRVEELSNSISGEAKMRADFSNEQYSDIAVLRSGLEISLAAIAALNNDLTTEKEQIDELKNDFESEKIDRVHESTALKEDIKLLKVNMMERVNEIAVLKISAENLCATVALKSDFQAEMTKRVDEVVVLKEELAANAERWLREADRVVFAQSQARVHDNGALQEEGIHESPPTQGLGVEQDRDASEVVARPCFEEQLLDNAGLQRTNVGLVDLDALVTAQENFLSRVEELSNSIDSANKARTILSEDFAKSQETLVARMEELSNRIDCEAKARETLSNDLVTSQMALASEMVELSNSVDHEVKARDLLSKGLETSQEVLASRVRALSNTVNCELEARQTLTTNLAVCLERLGELSNRVDCELHTRTILSKNLPPIDEDTSIDSESVQEVMVSRVEDMAASQETLMLQVKELLNTVDSETKARAGLSKDVGRGFDRILKLIQTLQSPDNCKACSTPFFLSSFAQRVTTHSESSFEVEISQERRCSVSSMSE